MHLLKTIQRIPERIRGFFPANAGESIRGITGRVRDALPHGETIRSIPRRLRSMFPVRTHADGENIPLIGQQGRIISFGKFRNTHKRK